MTHIQTAQAAHTPAVHGSRRLRAWRQARQFVRTPKGVVTVALLALTAVTGRVEGPIVLPGLAVSIATAIAVDLPLLRWRRGRWVLPSGALLTGLLVGVVLSSFEPLYVFATASGIGIAAKYVVRTRSANVFNPAALGLVCAYLLFDSAQNWWGALQAIVPGAAWPLLLGTGLYVTYYVNKMPLVVAFAATYFVLFAAATFVVDPADVAEVFVAPDLRAAAYLACFILTDPPTSPTRYRAQVACGCLVAAASVAIFVGLGAADYLLAGVLAGNLFEAARRQRSARTGRTLAAA